MESVMGQPADGDQGHLDGANLQDFAALTLDLALPDACIPGVQACLAELAAHAGRVRAFALPDPEPSA
jgi:hypothetical protein